MVHLIGLITALIASLIFYLILSTVDKKRRIKKVEFKIAEAKLGKRLPKDFKQKLNHRSNYYYAFLFFLASLVAFYERSLLLVTIYSLIIFLTGLIMGYYILIYVVKRSKK